MVEPPSIITIRAPGCAWRTCCATAAPMSPLPTIRTSAGECVCMWGLSVRAACWWIGRHVRDVVVAARSRAGLGVVDAAVVATAAGRRLPHGICPAHEADHVAVQV